MSKPPRKTPPEQAGAKAEATPTPTGAGPDNPGEMTSDAKAPAKAAASTVTSEASGPAAAQTPASKPSDTPGSTAISTKDDEKAVKAAEKTPQKPTAKPSEKPAATSSSKAAATAIPPTGATPRQSSAPVAPPATKSSGGLVMPLLGGVLAAALGAAAALYLLPDGWTGAARTDALQAQIDRLDASQGDLAALRAEIPADPSAAIALVQDSTDAATAETRAALADVSEQLDRLSAASDAQAQILDALKDTQEGLTGRIGALELRPVDSAPDIAALQADVRTLTERLETAASEARAQVEAASARAAEVEQMVASEAANDAVRAAHAALTDQVGSGQPYGDTLGAFALAAPDLSVNPVLVEHSEAGVASLDVLRAEFPDAARAALAVANDAAAPDGQASMMDRFSSFVRAQTGARSLSPREGDDPDAVLSRAEAAVANGDTAAALAELAALPPDVAAPMAQWQALADTRAAVMAAVADLSVQMNSN